MRSLLLTVGLLLATAPAAAQDYRFPTTADHYQHFYPTAYKDHAGVDWFCGDIRYAGHNGSDFGGGGFAGMDEGRDIVAAADGVVGAVHDGEFDRCTGECTDGGFGNYVRLDHADGKLTYYAHLKQWSITVAVGETVTCGQLIGQMGSSGNSTGPHLHFEVRVDGTAHDPFYGDCNSPPSYWVDQGEHGMLPAATCVADLVADAGVMDAGAADAAATVGDDAGLAATGDATGGCGCQSGVGHDVWVGVFIAGLLLTYRRRRARTP